MSDILKSTKVEETVDVAQLEKRRQELSRPDTYQEPVRDTGAIQRSEQFKEDNVQLKNGEWINKSVYEKLSKEEQDILMERGVSGYNAYLVDQADKQAEEAYEKALAEYNKEKAKFESENIKLSTGEWVTKENYNSLPSYLQPELDKRVVAGVNTLLNNPTE
jgi:hypothetical protein